MTFSEIWNKLLPTAAISVASCALMKAIEAGQAWQASLLGLFLLYSVAVTMSRMK